MVWSCLPSQFPFKKYCLLALILHDNHYIMNTASNRVKRQLLWKARFEINCLVQVASGDWKKFWKCSPKTVFLFFKYDKTKWMFWTYIAHAKMGLLQRCPKVGDLDQCTSQKPPSTFKVLKNLEENHDLAV